MDAAVLTAMLSAFVVERRYLDVVSTILMYERSTDWLASCSFASWLVHCEGLRRLSSLYGPLSATS